MALSYVEREIRAVQSIFHVSRDSALIILNMRRWMEYQNYLNSPFDPRD